MKEIDFKSGKIIFDEFFIDFSKMLSGQLDNLSEDLLQVEFKNGCILDVGWYPEYDAGGEFIIQVIKNQNWEMPIYKVGCREREDFFHNIKEAIMVSEQTA